MSLGDSVRNFFGFKFLRNEETEQPVSFVPPREEGIVIDADSAFGIANSLGVGLDIEGSFKSEKDLITRYREISLYSEVESAIQDIINEAIAPDGRGDIISLDLSDVDLPGSIKDRIHAEWDEILSLYRFDVQGTELFRKWYVEGRIFFHLVLDSNNPKSGVIECRNIDPVKLKKITEIKKTTDHRTGTPIIGRDEQYFVFSETGSENGIKISVDSIAESTSGVLDGNSGIVLSHLHKAIRPANQLRMIEDANIIYYLSRAPERRVFSVETGDLPRHKAEQYIREMMNQYRNKQVYDVKTGEIKDSRKFLSMMEDFWMPMRDGKGTTITNLQGGTQLTQQLESIEYFRKKLYSALNIPLSRLEGGAAFNVGRASEISRDELKFAKFVQNLRVKFVSFMLDTLRVNLLLKGVMTLEDWEDIVNDINPVFSKDNHYAEMKDLSVMESRLDILNKIDSYVGKFFSREHVMKNILGLTDEEIEEMNEQIANEKAKGEIDGNVGEEDLAGGDFGGGSIDGGGMSGLDMTPTDDEDTIGQQMPDELGSTQPEIGELPEPEQDQQIQPVPVGVTPNA